MNEIGETCALFPGLDGCAQWRRKAENGRKWAWWDNVLWPCHCQLDHVGEETWDGVLCTSVTDLLLPMSDGTVVLPWASVCYSGWVHQCCVSGRGRIHLLSLQRGWCTTHTITVAGQVTGVAFSPPERDHTLHCISQKVTMEAPWGLFHWFCSVEGPSWYDLVLFGCSMFCSLMAGERMSTKPSTPAQKNLDHNTKTLLQAY